MRAMATTAAGLARRGVSPGEKTEVGELTRALFGRRAGQSGTAGKTSARAIEARLQSPSLVSEVYLLGSVKPTLPSYRYSRFGDLLSRKYLLFEP